MPKPPPTNAIIFDPPKYDLQTYLEAACAAVRIDGWQKTGMPSPTWQRAKAILDDREMVIYPEDMAEAAQILQHMPYVLESDYHKKLAYVLVKKKIIEGDMPMAASAVISYQRWRARELLASSQTYIGKEDEPFDLPFVELVSSRSFERDVENWSFEPVDDYSRRGYHMEKRVTVNKEKAYVHVFHTPEKAVLVCFAYWPLNERFLRIAGTIKKHRVSSFTRLKETVISIHHMDVLPICKLCGKSTGPDGECACILTEDVWMPLGEFDIEVEDLEEPNE